MAEVALAEPGSEARPVPRMTYEEFLAWADEDTRAEWVNGEVVFMSPTSRSHQRVIRFLVRALGEFVEARQVGEIFSDSFQMRTGPDLPGRNPDVLFVANEHLSRVHETFLEGPADLAVEVVSVESRHRDTGEKFAEYQEGGVREYWLIDPDRRRAVFYLLGADGLYRPADLDAEGAFHSTVLPGLWLKVEWLWQEPKPLLREVLRAWGLA